MKQFALFALILFVFTSCEKDSEEVNNTTPKDYVVKIVPYYYTKENRQTPVPDIGSLIYVYYNIESAAFAGKKYLGDGMILIKEDTLKPNYKYIVDKPIYTFSIPRDSISDFVTIATVSSYYKERFIPNTFSLYSVKDTMSSTIYNWP